MSKTVKELADELGVTKQTIQYHYQRLSTKNQQRNSSGHILISPTAERLIRNRVTKNDKQRVDKEPTKSDKELTKNDKEDSRLISLLEKRLEELKKSSDKQIGDKERQISSKDRQIENKDQQITDLHKLLDQSQRLQLMAEKKIEKLEAPKEDEKKEASEKETPEVKQEEPKKKPWWRF